MKESQRTEFKRHWKDDWLKWISAFANAEGGVLMIGYDDQGQVFGIEKADKLLEDIPNKVRDILGIVVDVKEKYIVIGLVGERWDKSTSDLNRIEF